MSASDRVSVCLCTFQRPEKLALVLDGVLAQAASPAFAVEIVIVDNDRSRSAWDVVRRYQQNAPCPIVYDCEPEQNIAKARNRAVARASGGFIATIDDDEFPAPDWLDRLFTFLKTSQADGVLGPVVPRFPEGAPRWLAKSGLCDRPRHISGSPIDLRDMRTGNALFRRDLFRSNETWFSPSQGRGGEDGEFLMRQAQRGCRLVWCDEAVVYETVTEDRWTSAYYLRRYLAIGTMVGAYYRRAGDVRALVKEFAALAIFAALTPISALAGKAVGTKVAAKAAYHAGSVLASLHLRRVPGRR